MPTIYLSPSTQEGNFYVNGGTEEEWMNRLADAMEPWLDASGIQYTRNTPNMTAASSIRASNAGQYDLHLALHSNASSPDDYGGARGILVFYYPTSTSGRRAAQLMADNLKAIYPLPNKVAALWVQNNLEEIARNIVLSLTEYFDIPFLSPRPPRQGVVDVNWGYLNIRSRPQLTAPVVARAYDGAALTILNQWEGWYLVRFGSVVGYASADFITLL